MSVELKCDRCQTQTTVNPTVTDSSVGTVVRNANLPNGWGTVQVAKFNQAAQTKHLCDSCRGDLMRFMTGTEVPRKLMPNDQVIVLQHEPLPNCHLIWDPEVYGGKGGLICAHDQPHRVRFLMDQDEKNKAVMADPGVTIRRAGTLTAEITGEVFNPGTGGTLKREDDPELFDAIVDDLKTLGHEKCSECGIDVTKLWMVIHMRQAHPDGTNEPEPCGGCLHPVHSANKCPDGECWCDEGLPAEPKTEGNVLNQYGDGPQCRMCRHAKHGTRRCLVDGDNPNGKCPCVGALEDQLSNMPSQRSAPKIEERSDGE